ncbi:FtsK/SpoIIIE domain-containing protein [Salinibacterium sp. ZJ77]|uniref:FtsK/SpoIIIE domain-containing protein n=1 Tax=Salinibacterium sp. ZJ77 TaxID=2708337 RepID=UPI001422835D|nr:FtsK/SpoIIIE domain-containing protein [Salinibacterium sp. ZJ77]
MTLRLTVQDAQGEDRSYLVRTDESTTVSEAAESLGVAPQAIAPGVDGSTRLDDAGIVSGSTVPSGAMTTIAAGRVRLEFVAGPFAGESVAVDQGADVHVGRAPGGITIEDAELALQHASLTVHPLADGEGRPQPLKATVTLLDAAGELTVNGEPAGRTATIVPADLLQLGSSVVRLGIAPAGDADISGEVLGVRGFNRPSRIQPPRRIPVVQLPGERPKDQDASPLPWLSAVIPVILGVTMATVFQRPIMLLMAAASPIMVIGSFLTNRRIAKRRGQRTEVEWVQEIEQSRARIAALVREQRLDRWYRMLDPVLIRDIATRPLGRLWERRRSDPDALLARVGVAVVPLEVSFEGGDPKTRHEERKVGVAPSPVGVDLAMGAVGVAGPSDAAQGVARAMLTSLATLRSPRELNIVVLCDKEQEAAWSWAPWLPHAQGSPQAVSFVGNTDLTRRERLRELSALLEARLREAGDREATFATQVIVVVDGARRYRMLPGMVALLERGHRVGIHVLALDSDRSRLPEECASVVTLDGGDPSIGRVEAEAGYHSNVLIDSVTPGYAMEVARALCGIEHVSGVGDDATLPTTVRFTELLDIDLDDPQTVVERWRVAPRQSHVVVGAGADGEFAIDIAADGPHALVAGTTGSGKSEFLQTLVIALALANRPDALNFVLIDYKGGSAFADCARLPHTVGVVTNLDARETERALASLDAELKRRERVLKDDIEAKDVDAAWEKDPEAAARHGLARLMIVIDEFAELKAELPEFINGIVRIARVGRSLGVNLVLATQRPSGVITPEIQSNVNLRVALRVTDRGDSSDIIGTGDAALIPSTNPGRGYVRAGMDAAPAPFQTARVASLRAGHQRVARALPPSAEVEWASVGLPPRFPAAAKTSHRPDQDDTDLRALVNLTSQAAQQLGVARNASPWLLPLPETLPLDRLDAPADPAELLLGLEDLPAEQSQRPLTWNVHTDSHLLFLGAQQSGRTSALRTILTQAVQRFTPADLHLYVADYGTGALLPLASAPHTGAVVTSLEEGRMARLMQKLTAELDRRRVVLAEMGVGGIAEQRRVADPRDALAYSILVIDGWERVSASMSGDEMVLLRDQVLRLLREGPAVGMRVVITADRSVTSEKIAAFIDRQYALRLRDVNEYRAAGIMVRDLPPSIPEGRVLFGSEGREAQLAVVSGDPAGDEQSAVLRGVVEHVTAHFASFPQLAELPQPERVDALPTTFPLSGVSELPLAFPNTPEFPVVAVGGDTMGRITLDWPRSGGFAIVGASRSGRSSTLALLAHQLAWAGAPVAVVGSAETPLAHVAAAHNLPLITLETPDDVLAAALAPREQRLTIVVDDAERIRSSPLEKAIIAAKEHSVFIAAISSSSVSGAVSGPFAEARRSGRGLLLSPSSSILGTQTFEVSLPKHLVGRANPGRGVMFANGAYLPVQIPDVRG